MRSNNFASLMLAFFVAYAGITLHYIGKCTGLGQMGPLHYHLDQLTETMSARNFCAFSF